MANTADLTAMETAKAVGYCEAIEDLTGLLDGKMTFYKLASEEKE